MNNTLSVSSALLSETESIDRILHHVSANQLSVAVWKLPNDPVRRLLISRQPIRLKSETPLEELPPGFIFAPFDRSKESLFLRADYIFAFDEGTLKVPRSAQEIDAVAWLLQLPPPPVTPLQQASGDQARGPSSPQSKAAFLQMVTRGVDEIEKGNLEKIVPSRAKTIDLAPSFDVATAFRKLCDAYPHALVSFVSCPETGSWLGASPETLVSVEQQRIFRTVALAGTKPYLDNIALKSVAWTQKEIEEQALVERYVISCFKKIRVREYEEHGPKTVVAGNLLHLKSDFTVDMRAINFPQLASVMLGLLHPTSAVCGMPLEPARAFLREHEGYDREFYAGYLGPVNIGSDIHIFVNLRCMKLQDGKAIAYAGAGVTADSTPEQEWDETEMKFNTLLNVI
ncbi:MAG TPA: chorismate-binding protein [Ohtaekwangia sp.]|nr:chorismate-binding protein [Ohtaekwangia sp.]